MINFRLETSAGLILDDKIHQVLLRASDNESETVRAQVSGQPLSIWGDDGHDLFFDDCPEQVATPMTIGRISLFRLPSTGHEHLPTRYAPETNYACLQGFDEAGNEYRMGILDVLGFEITEIIE